MKVDAAANDNKKGGGDLIGYRKDCHVEVVLYIFSKRKHPGKARDTWWHLTNEVRSARGSVDEICNKTIAALEWFAKLKKDERQKLLADYHSLPIVALR